METFPYQDLPYGNNQIYMQSDGNAAQSADNNMAGGGDGGLSPGNITPRRSLSQTILSQMSSANNPQGAGFGLATRSTSPSPLIGGSMRRTPSYGNRSTGDRAGFLSRGPSLQSLVKSFINRVSRGTQTDCDDNFDQISIASFTSGFSAIANDLSQSRLKLYFNNSNHSSGGNAISKSYASSHADDNDFVEELQKLRDEIDGEFASDNGNVGGSDEAKNLNKNRNRKFSDDQFDIDDLIAEESESISEKKSFQSALNAPVKIPVKICVDQAVETDAVVVQNQSTQTDNDNEDKATTKIDVCEKAISTEPLTQTDSLMMGIVSAAAKFLFVSSETQTVEEEKEQIIKIDASVETMASSEEPTAIDSPQSTKAIVLKNDSDVQTDLLKFCHHCGGAQLSTTKQPGNTEEFTTNREPIHIIHEPIIVQQQPPPPPQIMNCEFHISHADIICKENKVVRNRSDSVQSTPPWSPMKKPSPPPPTTTTKKSSAAMPGTAEKVLVSGDIPEQQVSTSANSIDDQELNKLESKKSETDSAQNGLVHQSEMEKNIPTSVKEVDKKIAELKVENLLTTSTMAEKGKNGINLMTNGEDRKETKMASLNYASPRPTRWKNFTASVTNDNDDATKKTKDGTAKKEKRSPKKGAQKRPLTILASSTDDEYDKRHQAALMDIKPKCCSVS